MAQAPRIESPPAPEGDSTRPGLRDVPRLPLRVGRHVTAWLLWHTSRVSLLDDAPEPAQFERAA